MEACQNQKKNLVLYVHGEMDSNSGKEIENHLASCRILPIRISAAVVFARKYQDNHIVTGAVSQTGQLTGHQYQVEIKRQK